MAVRQRALQPRCLKRKTKELNAEPKSIQLYMCVPVWAEHIPLEPGGGLNAMANGSSIVMDKLQ